MAYNQVTLGCGWHFLLLVVQAKNVDDANEDDLLINVRCWFQSQITVMDFPAFKAIQPDVSCIADTVFRFCH